MATRLAELLPRLAVLTFAWLLATSTITFAAAGQEIQQTEQPSASPAPTGPERLVVPDVRRQAYVFAKGILEDAGFAWKVKGSVHGFAANTVAVQVPAPGVKVVDTGAPTIVLRLTRNKQYAERGLPENASSHGGTELVLASEAAKAAAKQPPAKKTKAAAPDAQPADADAAAPRKPAFHAPGAAKEPLDEMPLPDRARLLQKRLAGQANPTKALVRYWLFQHAWIVTGARFGWSGGADALRTLIRVDRDLEARWGVGGRSRAVARAALAEVERKSEK